MVSDRVLTLYRPCEYPGAVLQHASRDWSPKIRDHYSLSDQILTPGIVEMLQKASQTQTLKKPQTTTLLLTIKLFLKLDCFSQTILGRWDSISRICRVKKNIQRLRLQWKSLDGEPAAKRSSRSPTGVEKAADCTETRRSMSLHSKENIWRNRRAGCLQETT